MKKIFLLVQILLLANCTEKERAFQQVDCNPSDSTLNNNVRRVFRPCREYIYEARYWDSEHNLISEEQIWMMASGNGWDSELQDEIIIQYSYDNSKTDYINQYSINPEIANWEAKTVTGIIESREETWMHPFRSNQYAFTEVASFPSVKFPLEIGKTWTSNLSIHEGWGVWSNSTLYTTYEVIDHEFITTEFKELEAWHVRGVTSAEFGNSGHDFWYNEEYGFVKMLIKNYAGQLLLFELMEVKER